jgi:ubiquinone/menaquinone biosynthesis C-methylase UbiE
MPNLYETNEYLKNNPSLHIDDSPYKINIIIPLIDKFIGQINSSEINILDVGSGAGLILKGITDYIRSKYSMKVNKYLLDLSPGMIDYQRNVNPDFQKALNEDVCLTTLSNKEIDLVLMIDVLEHIPEPKNALSEIKRISNYAIFKVPLENSSIFRVWDFIRRGMPLKRSIEQFSHVNFYTRDELKRQLRGAGVIIYEYYENAFIYFASSPQYNNIALPREAFDFSGKFLNSYLPGVSTFLSHTALFLVRCDSI